MWHASESLFTYDRNFSPIPMLADAYTVSDRGLRNTIALRREVKFHNGKEAIYDEDVGIVKIADYFTLDAARRELRGPFRAAPRIDFWNSWLAK